MNAKQKSVVADVLYFFIVAAVFISIVAGIVIAIHLHIESGKYHHKTRVGDLFDYLHPYEDCYVTQEEKDTTTTRSSAVIVTLKCVK